jgi:hypothetical protein
LRARAAAYLAFSTRRFEMPPDRPEVTLSVDLELARA